MSTASPDAVRASLRRLHAAGDALRKRPAREVLDVLGALLERLRDPTDPARRRIETELPAAAGFSPEIVREGLARGLASWTGAALRALVDVELGDAEAFHGAPTTAAILAGAIPMPALLEVVAALCVRSPVLAKPSAHDPVTAPAVAGALAELDPALGQCVALADFRHDDEACMDALCQADCVVVTGSDTAVSSLAARVLPPRRLVAHGHRISLAALGPAALEEASLAEAARGLALDTALWDQLGCCSPVAVYVAGPTAAAGRAAHALADALADAEARWPRGTASPEAEAAAAHERALAEMRGAELLADPGARWSVVVEPDAQPRPAPLHRFLRIHPVTDAAALIEGIRPLGAKLAGVALAGFAADTLRLEAALRGAGATRTCAPGSLQAPPLAWHRDGLPVLRRLLPGA